VPAGHARIAVGHVRSALFVHRRHEADAGRGKQVQRIHEGRTDDAENILDALRDQRFDKRFAGGHVLLAAHGLSPGMPALVRLLVGRCDPILRQKSLPSHPRAFHFLHFLCDDGQPIANSSIIER